MAGFEAEGSQKKIWSIAALLLLLVSAVLFLGNSPALGLVAILMAFLFLLLGRRVESIKGYAILDDRISIEGTDRTIPFSKIIDCEFSTFRMMKVWMHDGNPYYFNKTMATQLLSLMGEKQEVLVYTGISTNVFLMNDCYILTPENGEAFVRELKEKLDKYRASHPPESGAAKA